MARIKRRRHARSHHETKPRKRKKTDFFGLVCKYFNISPKKDVSSRGRVTGEVRNSRNKDGRVASMVHKLRRGTPIRITRSKLHGVERRHRTTKDRLASSCIQEYAVTNGIRQLKKYLKKALDFGIESGYLVPSCKNYKLLRVSSNLDGRRTNRRSVSYDRSCSRDKDESVEGSSMRFDDRNIEDARRKCSSGSGSKRRRRARSRSARQRYGSRRAYRRRRNSENPEEMDDDDDDDNDDDDYELEEENRKGRNEKANDNVKHVRTRPEDDKKVNGDKVNEISDMSLDEEESDYGGEEDEENEDNTKKKE